MDNPIILLMMMFVYTSCCTKHEQIRVGCTNPVATNYDTEADQACDNCCVIPPKKGGVLFWTTQDDLIFGARGAMFVHLSDGRSNNVVGYYDFPPSNCVNQVGGYFYLEEGKYTYEVFAADDRTKISNGEITVVEGCNRFKITL